MRACVRDEDGVEGTRDDREDDAKAVEVMGAEDTDVLTKGALSTSMSSSGATTGCRNGDVAGDEEGEGRCEVMRGRLEEEEAEGGSGE